MNQNDIDILLKNYTALLKKVDAHIQRIENNYPGDIACKKGCDACCRFLSLFPVEAFALAAAFSKLAAKTRERVAIMCEGQEETCPLLQDSQCVLYRTRPIICRTHGLPIYIEKDGKTLVDFCPENFKEIRSFPSDLLLNLEQLNTLLTVINQHFIESVDTDLPDRIPISQALFMLQEP